MSLLLNRPTFGPKGWMMATFAALVATAVFAHILFTGLQARSWSSVKAVVSESELSPNGAGGSRLSVVYTYVFDGQVFAGTRLGFTAGATPETLARDYAVGREVNCYVNPARPRQAMLRRELSGGHYAAPAVFLVTALGLASRTRRSLSQIRPAPLKPLAPVAPTSDREPADLSQAA